MLLFKGKRIFSDHHVCILRYTALKAIGGLNLSRGWGAPPSGKCIKDIAPGMDFASLAVDEFWPYFFTKPPQ